MKIEELFPKEGENVSKAKRICAKAKGKAKKNNPGETEERAGWGVDPHQGYFNSLRMTR